MKTLYKLIILLFTANLLLASPPRQIWLKHGQDVSFSCFTFSPDGKLAYLQSKISQTIEDMNSIKVLDLKTQKIIREFPILREMRKIDISPEGKYLIGCNTTRFVELIDIEAGKTIRVDTFDVAAMDYIVNSISFLPDSKRYAIKEILTKQLQIFDFQTGAKSYLDIGGDTATNVIFSQNKNYFSVVRKDSTFGIWSSDSLKEIMRIRYKSIPNSFSFSNDGKYFLANYTYNDDSNNVKIYKIATGQLYREATTTFKYPVSLFSSDNKQIITGSSRDEEVYISTIDNPGNKDRISCKLWGYSLKCSPTETAFGGIDRSSGTFGYFSISNGSELFRVNANYSPNNTGSNCIKFHPTVPIIYVTTSNGIIRVKEFQTGFDMFSFKANNAPVTFFDISQDGKSIVTCGGTDSIRIWNNKNYEKPVLEKSFKLPDDVSLVTFTPSLNYIVAACPKVGGYLINYKDFQFKKFDTTYLDIISMDIYPDGKKICMGTKEGYIIIYKFDIPNVTYVKDTIFVNDKNISFTEISSAKFSPDGKRIATSGLGSNIYIWDASNYSLLTKLKINSSDTDPQIRSLAFTQIGNKIVAGDSLGSLYLYDISSGAIFWKDSSVFNRNNLPHSVNYLSLSQNGNFMAVCADDGSSALYDIAPVLEVEEMNDDKVNIIVYPNPANDFINIGINTTNTLGIKVLLINILGEEIPVNRNEIPQGNSYLVVITLANNILPSGIYFIKIQTGSSVIYKKIQIIKSNY
ncbi:MAG: tolB 4 [Ignavibacteria bacterium]|nr:tolB 4 [Ignavibacteria bacterium]